MNDEIKAMVARVVTQDALFEQAKDNKEKAEQNLLTALVGSFGEALHAMACTNGSPAVPRLPEPIDDPRILISPEMSLYLLPHGTRNDEQPEWAMQMNETWQRLHVSTVLQHIDLPTVTAILLRDLKRQDGSRTNATDAINEETEKLKAITVLIRSTQRNRRNRKRES